MRFIALDVSVEFVLIYRPHPVITGFLNIVRDQNCVCENFYGSGSAKVHN
jgi:hypothetical protein